MSATPEAPDTARPETPLLGTWGLPLLAAVLSVTLLARQNLDRGFGSADLVLPLGAGLGTGLLVWGGFRLFGRDPAFIALGAGAVTTILLFGGRIEEGLLRWFVFPGALHWTVVGLVLLVLPLLLLIRLGHSRLELATPVRVAEVTGLILLLATAVPLAIALPRGGVTMGDGDQMPALPATAGDPLLPDIHFIVLDAYSGPASLRSVYGIDIEDLTEELRRLGFVTPVAARANYTHTALALVSMLNWHYLQEDPELRTDDGDGVPNRGDLYPLLHDNRTTRLLRRLGYRTVFFSSSYPPLRDSPGADDVVSSPGIGELEATWVRQTLAGPAERVIHRRRLRAGTPWPFRADAAPVHEWRFAELVRRARESQSPTFFYVHLLLPHEPFVFGPECEHVEPVWPLTWEEVEDPVVHRRYGDQVKCLNTLLLRTVRTILEDGRGDPVILLQSDHGYARFPRGQTTSFEETDEERLRERMDIFAAYRLPAGHELAVPDTVTPINAMRAVMSSVFGADLPLLEDRSYWSSWQRPFGFTEIPPALLERDDPGDP